MPVKFSGICFFVGFALAFCDKDGNNLAAEESGGRTDKRHETVVLL